MLSLLEVIERGRLAASNGHPKRRSDEGAASDLDREALARELQATVRGEVRFDDGSRALYSTDASNYRQIPLGVVIPLDAEDVVATVATCRQFGAPVVSRGGGTSLAGNACNVAVVMDFSKAMNRIVELDPHTRRARVQPGCVLDDLRDAAGVHGLTYGPDPATHSHNTLGGMIGNNSCGMHAQMAGKVEENIEELEILTYDGVRLRVGPTSDDELAQIIAAGGRRGEIYAELKAIRDRYADDIRARFPNIPRRVSGYNLNELLPENGFHVARALVGSESTCITILEATCKLIPNPPCRSLVVLGFPDVFEAADLVPFINEHVPIALEGFDDRLIDFMHAKGMRQEDIEKLPPGKGWLMVEFGADSKGESDAQAEKLIAACQARTGAPSSKLVDRPFDEQQLWSVREAALGASAKVPHHPDYWAGWEDSAAPPDRFGDYLRELRALYDRFGYDAAFYGHFGQGCIHCRVSFDLVTAEGIATYRRFMREAAELISRFGGSLSGEHGDGQARAEFLPIMFGQTIIEAFGRFKRVWDPANKMNPGKVVDPDPVDKNLRLGANYEPWEPKTHFSFHEDGGSFAYAANRCVGVGKCRRHAGGVMCPSYQVTREEKDSTRGRARLLFEMLQGNPLHDGWQDEAVKDALDLCLACKGCKGQCPVNVDMATYKAEFLSHYFTRHLRPRSAYAFGLIMYWAHVASYAPWLVNAVTQTPLLRDVAKFFAGMAPQRSIPAFAPKPFKTLFAERQPRNPNGPPVILWADTFNNYFHTATAVAAVDVLEDAGFRVIVPLETLCCGRPLYDYGMLDLAKTFLRQVLASLRPHIEAGTCVVGLEPSCVSVFREELLNMLPHDPDAQRLAKQTFMLGEFLATKTDYKPPRLARKALVQEHCHHASVLGTHGEKAMFEKLGLDYEILDSGCCGMAGAFGFEAGDHYEVSLKAGERVLLPRARAALPETLLISDGFSCREQISQTTDRHGLHLAQILKMAIDAGPNGPAGPRPERAYLTKPAKIRPAILVLAAAFVLTAVGFERLRAASD
ncbi:MAG: FAD-binding oxidoreductase [Candidatus Eremiobacteraeota bacterium]|nr:FAD-binding oxidoreductase [Candidatus Eremiobacteraeota bacterium]